MRRAVQTRNQSPPDLAPTTRATMERDAKWCPAWYRLDDGRLEEWLLDQVGLSLLPSRERFRILGEMVPVVERVRASLLEGADPAALLAALVPEDASEWLSFEVGGTFNVWRQGHNAWALQLRRAEDDRWRWQAGHAFQPFTACTATTQEGKPCGRMAAVLAPRCLTHVDRGYRQALYDDALAESSTSSKSE